MRGCGVSERKATYILEASMFFKTHDIQSLEKLDNETLIESLTALRGIGRWTAEMLLIFSLNRLDVFPKDDLAIQRGISMLYHHKKVTKELLLKYEKRYHPYGSVASLYLWEISSGKYGHTNYQLKK